MRALVLRPDADLFVGAVVASNVGGSGLRALHAALGVSLVDAIGLANGMDRGADDEGRGNDDDERRLGTGSRARSTGASRATIRYAIRCSPPGMTGAARWPHWPTGGATYSLARSPRRSGCDAAVATQRGHGVTLLADRDELTMHHHDAP